jgi:tyrosyl-tRNA synthetase
MGREIQKNYGQTPQVVMTVPILEGTDGVQKMSKSLGNAIGITLPPDEMFGKVMSIPDSLILPFFQYTTTLSKEECAAVKARLAAGENPRDLKAELARTIVAFYHSGSAAQKASEGFDKLFRDKELPADIPERKVTSRDFPSLQADTATLLFWSGLAVSKSEARRLVEQGGVKINNEKVSDLTRMWDLKQTLLIQAGKRKFLKVIFSHE